MFGSRKKALYCTGCGCLLHFAWRSVPVTGSPCTVYFTGDWEEDSKAQPAWNFCRKCVPPYDRVRYVSHPFNGGWKHEAHFYIHSPEVEVTEDGKEIEKGKK